MFCSVAGMLCCVQYASICVLWVLYFVQSRRRCFTVMRELHVVHVGGAFLSKMKLCVMYVCPIRSRVMALSSVREERLVVCQCSICGCMFCRCVCVLFHMSWC